MRAEWNDAPQRVHKRSKNKPFLVALATVAGLFFVGAYVSGAIPAVIKSLESRDQDQDQDQDWSTRATPASARETGLIRPAAQPDDPYLEQVNRMLRRSAAESNRQQAVIEWAEPPGEPPRERQTVFNDANYIPSTTVNTVRLPRPAAQPAAPRSGQTPYVTVVKETRASCGFHKPGSLECRRFRAYAYRTHSRVCLQSRDSQSMSCRLAKAYEPTR